VSSVGFWRASLIVRGTNTRLSDMSDPNRGDKIIAARAGSSGEGLLGRCAATNRREDLSHPTLLYHEQNESTGAVEINGRTVKICSGDCLVLPARCVLHEDAWRHFDYTVTLDVAEASIATFVREFPQDAALGIGRITVPEADRQRWKDHLNRLRRELTIRAPRGRDAAQALLTLFAVDAARYAAPSVPAGLSARRVVAEVLRHINDHIAAPISLREIAKAVHFSPAYLTDLMKRETGRPVVSWIIELRLQRAEHLLSQTDQPISQIAATVGYVDANSFGRAFTKRRGLSPFQWRRRHGIR
jgi:AraC-like DNA-binding protein